jgi:hypothetical protein
LTVEVSLVRRVFAVVVGSLLFIVVGVAVAQGAGYAVWACANGSGKALSAGDWSAGRIGSIALATTTCGGGGDGGAAGYLQAIVGGGPGQANTATNAEWRISAAAGTRISALDVWWMNQAGVQSPGRVEVFAGSRSLYARDSGAFGSATLPFDAANHQSFSGLSEPSASLVAWCLTGCARADRSISALFHAYRLKVSVSDDVAPTGTAAGVSQGMTLAAPVSLHARASDAGSGVRDLQLVVDGKVIETREAGGQCTDIDPSSGGANDYAVMRPCAAQLPAAGVAPATFTLSPATLAGPGAHRVAVVAHDAAGNQAALLSAQVQVAAALKDGPPPAGFFDAGRGLFFNPDADVGGPSRPNGSAAGPANVSLAFVERRVVRRGARRRVVRLVMGHRLVGFSTVARMRGRVTTPAGQPIAGARVYRAISVAGEPWRLTAPPLLTSSSGSVSLALAAFSPSRRVQLVYFPDSASNDNMRSPVALLRVRAPVTLSVTPRSVRRGTRISVSARVGGMRPGASVIGALQLREGGSWRTIRQLRFAPRGHGRARTALRLRVPASYRLRVRVSAQPGVRYATGASQPRTLRVS